jgi:colanic acid biosynthesis glycosyl transferase WcaI
LLWLLIGGGEDRAAIEREIAERKLANIRLLPFQPAKTLPDMYSSADIVLLNQTATLEGAVIPSKLLTYMAAGRPVVAAVSEKSEAARLIRDADCGVIAAAEDPESLVAAVLSLRADCELRKKLGANGRAYAEEHFTKANVLRAYDEFFQKVLAVPKAYLLAPEKFADE